MKPLVSASASAERQISTSSLSSSSSSSSDAALPDRHVVRSSGQRKRKSGAKVKTGCLTCKTRRVKCDETKPKCLRCLKFGVVCDGYVSPPKPIGKETRRRLILPKKKPQENFESSHMVQITRLHTGAEYLDELDGQFFRIFLEETAKQIHSVFPSSLWDRLIPQISQAEPFIRHAIVAIGALAKQSKTEAQRRLAGTVSQSSDYQHALKQYDKSLRGMREAIANGQHDLRKALVACLLVFCFENMLGNQASAAMHAESGLMLLYHSMTGKTLSGEAWETEKIWHDHLLEQDLLEAFNALDLQVLLFIDNRSKAVHEYMKESQNRVIATMPRQLRTLTLARQYWNLIITRNYHFNKSLQAIDIEKIKEQRTDTPWEDSANLQTGELLLSDSGDASSSLKEEHMRYLIDIDRWTLASAQLFAELAAGPQREYVGSQILQVQAKISHIMLAGTFFITETAYDMFFREFKAIVAHSETILPYVLSSYEGAAPRFHFDIGIVAALYLVGSRCRDYGVRTRAIDLLFLASIREGVWDALSVAHMAKWIRDIEIEGLDSEWDPIPEEKRAFLSAVNVDLHRRRAIVGATQRTKDGTKQRKTLLTW